MPTYKHIISFVFLAQTFTSISGVLSSYEIYPTLEMLLTKQFFLLGLNLQEDEFSVHRKKDDLIGDGKNV